MEEEKSGYLNSPTIQKNTPIKRLGLSRKRKSSGTDTNLLNKVLVSGDSSPLSPFRSQNTNTSTDKEILKDKLNSENLLSQEEELYHDENDDEDCNNLKNLRTKINSVKQRIEEKKEKLKCLSMNKNNRILELENLLETWKNGCRSAYLHFVELIKQKNVENIDYKTILIKLGIWETIVQHFENDSEICISDIL